MPNNKKGFTLIELLVVMGILGILMAVTILVINPAEYLRRSRDTQRINDVQAVNSAVGLAISQGGTLTNLTVCWSYPGATITRVCNGGGTAVPTTGDRTLAGSTGWVKGIDLTTGGQNPFGALPIDPSALAATYYYLWSSTASVYEIAVATFESTYYVTTNPIASNDGGIANTSCTAGTYNKDCLYEIGTSLSLIAKSA